MNTTSELAKAKPIGSTLDWELIPFGVVDTIADGEEIFQRRSAIFRYVDREGHFKILKIGVALRGVSGNLAPYWVSLEVFDDVYVVDSSGFSVDLEVASPEPVIVRNTP